MKSTVLTMESAAGESSKQGDGVHQGFSILRKSQRGSDPTNYSDRKNNGEVENVITFAK